MQGSNSSHNLSLRIQQDPSKSERTLFEGWRESENNLLDYLSPALKDTLSYKGEGFFFQFLHVVVKKMTGLLRAKRNQGLTGSY
ncbi:MAG: hypothetical protein LCH30_04150 [Proteobacteria bacterium]|nr:hypothetical protein [Pseudomonadota bacterium]